MEYTRFAENLRQRLEKVLKDRGDSFEHLNLMMNYLGNCLLSDSAVYEAMQIREIGGTTQEMLRAAYKGAFGIEPSSNSSFPGLDPENQRFALRSDTISNIP